MTGERSNCCTGINARCQLHRQSDCALAGKHHLTHGNIAVLRGRNCPGCAALPAPAAHGCVRAAPGRPRSAVACSFPRAARPPAAAKSVSIMPFSSRRRNARPRFSSSSKAATLRCASSGISTHCSPRRASRTEPRGRARRAPTQPPPAPRRCALAARRREYPARPDRPSRPGNSPRRQRPAQGFLALLPGNRRRVELRGYGTRHCRAAWCTRVGLELA